MIKAWKEWRKTTSLSDGTFLKLYIYDRILIRPRRKVKKWLR